MAEKKYYQLGTFSEEQWDELNLELTGSSSSATIPDRCVELIDDQLHSKTRGTYLLTTEEAEILKTDPRVRFINIDFKRYDEYTPPKDELQATRPELISRYSSAVKNYREFEVSNTLSVSPLASDGNRTGYQLYRCQQKLDPWVNGSLADNALVNTNIYQYGTGKHVDVIVADEGMWIGHPEFQSNSVLVSGGFPLEKPNGYVGGNLLPGNGTCDVLDLVLDAPYYIDPEWFDADPIVRLINRWDGTIVPRESEARAWWSNPAQRSAKFANAGTVEVPYWYKRQDTSGSNTVQPSGGDGEHGTPCGALTFGRTQGWAYNANKWTLDLYGSSGIGIERGFDAQKIFHQLKPINPLYGTKDPTISSNSWGYRSNKDPGGSEWYYTHRSTTNAAYTTEAGIAWLSHMGTQGDNGRWKGEMKTNSITTALDELIQAGVIFVAAAGNSNQKQVSSDHPDFNNYITTTNGGSLADSNFIEIGLPVYGTTNRRGFPQQGGMFTSDNGTRIYPVINVGALDDDFKSGLEAKVSYSDRGNEIDVYAPADGTLAANKSYVNEGPRPDTYFNFTYALGAYDCAFGGTSAACPVACGFIATILEHNRDWTWQEVKSWLKTLDPQDVSNFYLGAESTTENTANWVDYQSLEGGTPRVLYQGYFDSRYKPGIRKVSSGLNITGLRYRK